MCAAFVASRTHEPLWTRCRRAPAAGDIFCRAHGEAIAGALLGLVDLQRLISEETAARAAVRRGATFFSNRYWTRRRCRETMGAAASGKPSRDADTAHAKAQGNGAKQETLG